MTKTLKQFFLDLGGLSYDNGDYRIVRNNFRTKEVNAFCDCFLPGTEILSDGKNGAPLVMKGSAHADVGADPLAEIEFSGYQLYDYSDTDGNWALITLPSLAELEDYLLSEAGYLNFFSTQMFVFEDGIEKPFELMFCGDHNITLAIDKDGMDMPFDIPAMRSRIFIRWKDPIEDLPLTDEDIAAYKASL